MKEFYFVLLGVSAGIFLAAQRIDSSGLDLLPPVRGELITARRQATILAIVAGGLLIGGVKL